MIQTKGYAAQSPTSPLAPFSFERRDPGPNDVQIDILYCGVCHSDIHTARDEWGGTMYPCVPGHEIVGRVVKVGNKVAKFKEGDLAAVGCMVDSCRNCDGCKAGLEQYCDKTIFTYNGPDKHTGKQTFGGYSKSIVVTQDFVLKVPTNLDLKRVAPLLCAGITTYSPLRHWKVGPGQKVGVVGLGGLGHMAVKLAHAMGSHVTLFTTSPNKVEDGKKLGAHDVIISKDKDQMAKAALKFDFILDCVSAQHDINALLNCLKLDGTLVQVGAPPQQLPVAVFQLIFKRRTFAGSLIGGIPETQEMLDFCGKHNIMADIELISIDKINEAYERMIRSDVKYRFVIDLATLS